LYNTHNVGNINCHRVAFSDYNGEVKMKKEWEHLIDDKDGDEVVVCKTGDDFCNDLKVVPDIIKIDTEGSELKVLRGIKDTLSKHHPIIFLEIHAQRIKDYGDNLRDICDLLKGIGYSATDCVSGNKITYDEIELSTEDTRIIFTYD